MLCLICYTYIFNTCLQARFKESCKARLVELEAEEDARRERENIDPATPRPKFKLTFDDQSVIWVRVQPKPTSKTGQYRVLGFGSQPITTLPGGIDSVIL